MKFPKIINDDAGEIRAEMDGEAIRSWSYEGRDEERAKMLAAREFAEGWYCGLARAETEGRIRRRHKAPEGRCKACDQERKAGAEHHPPHDASSGCKSGGREHCSCDTCF